jgi:hypothetical protein
MTLTPETSSGTVIPSKQLHERLSALEQQYPVRCDVNPKYGYCAGVFGGGHHKEIEQGLLYISPFEHYVIRAIQTLVHFSGRPVLVLDEGGMAGESMVVVGYALRDLVHSGNLELFVSNYESHYTHDALLAECERRFNFLPFYKEITAIHHVDRSQTDELSVLKYRTKPLVTTQAEVDFIRSWSYLVEFTEGVNVFKLAQSFPDVMAEGGFHFIHDSYAGLLWSGDPERALQSEISCSDIKYGVIMSNDFPEDCIQMDQMIRGSLSCKSVGVIQPYDTFLRPHSPVRELTISDEMPIFGL